MSRHEAATGPSKRSARVFSHIRRDSAVLRPALCVPCRDVIIPAAAEKALGDGWEGLLLSAAVRLLSRLRTAVLVELDARF